MFTYIWFLAIALWWSSHDKYKVAYRAGDDVDDNSDTDDDDDDDNDNDDIENDDDDDD